MPRAIDVVKPKVILLDIDGTCGPLSFFPNTMQPYLPNNLRQYIGKNFKSPVLQDIMHRLRLEYKRQIPKDLDHRVDIPVHKNGNEGEILNAVFTSFIAQTDEGKKSETILALAWLVWLDGFRSGALKGEVFPDVPGALERWKAEGIMICTISSMISLGQQMLFTCSAYGNLDELIDGYLCTKDIEAHKSQKKCYQGICDRLDKDPSDLLFLTDVGKEAVAAKEAGCRSILVERPGNVKISPLFSKKYNVITSFQQFSFV